VTPCVERLSALAKSSDIDSLPDLVQGFLAAGKQAEVGLACVATYAGRGNDQNCAYLKKLCRREARRQNPQPAPPAGGNGQAPLISFVTSHFATSGGLVPTRRLAQKEAALLVRRKLNDISHYQEIEKAFLVNLNNAELDEVVVIYDSVTPLDNCTHLTRRLAQYAKNQRAPMQIFQKFQCVSRAEAQPSYFEMFEYVRTLPLKGDVAVMSNADGVLDETVAKLRQLPEGGVVTLSVSHKHAVGQDAERHINEMYRRTLGEQYCWPRPRCPHPKEGQAMVFSWDAYALRKPFPQLSDKILTPDLYMNQMGAENRAGLALLLHLAAAPWRPDGLDAYGPADVPYPKEPPTIAARRFADGRTEWPAAQHFPKWTDASIGNHSFLPSACGHVNWYHFHCGPKSHHDLLRVDYSEAQFWRDFPGVQEVGSRMGFLIPPQFYESDKLNDEAYIDDDSIHGWSSPLYALAFNCDTFETCLAAGVDAGEQEKA